MSIGAESSSNINYNLVTEFFCHDVYVRFLHTDVRYLANLWHVISFLALEGEMYAGICTGCGWRNYLLISDGGIWS